MITVPLWLFATLCATAGLALLGLAAALARAQHHLDHLLEEELGPRPPWVGDQEQADRDERGQT